MGINRHKAEAAAARLTKAGLVFLPLPEVTRQVADIIESVYDPKPSRGKRASFDDVEEWDEIEPGTFENQTCFVQTGTDIQSGPYYCGEPATFMGHVENGCIFCCGKHAPRKARRKTKEEDEQNETAITTPDA